MATNYLTPFANGTSANVADEVEWQSNRNRTGGFKSGIASSKQFNRAFAQGNSAAYALGQFVVDYAGQDATINASALYTAFKSALNSWQGTARTLTDNQKKNACANIGAVSSKELASEVSALSTEIGTKLNESDLMTALSDLIAEFGGTVPTD